MARRARTGRRRGSQLKLEYRTWGGRRRGAGRKPADPNRTNVSHKGRPKLDARTPVLVTMRVGGVPSLRKQELRKIVRRRLDKGNAREDFRICHYSIQPDHIHMIVEAANARALSRGMQGLSVRISRGVNGKLGRQGKLFTDRYHDRQLKTPTQVRHGLAYVLCNWLRHEQHWKHGYPKSYVDPCSSALAFDGWSMPVTCPDARPPPVKPARTWLLSTGWRRSKLGPVVPWNTPGNGSVKRMAGRR